MSKKAKKKAAKAVQVNKSNDASTHENKGDRVLFAGEFGISQRFATLNRLITRDLNNVVKTPTFTRYSKDNIAEYLKDPYRYEKQLRDAVTYIYGASSHFRRLIQYFAGLSDLSYVISPYRIDPGKASVNRMNSNYRKVMNFMSLIDHKQLAKILTVCLREDTFYGTCWLGADNITIQQLPPDYCKVSAIEGNVLNIGFDFSYFDRYASLLDYYPPEFRTKYETIYKKNTREKWIDLDSPTSFAIKANDDILDYSLPPFAGILREVYDIEDLKQLRLTKTTLDNYAMLVMNLEADDEGNWKMDLGKAKEFYRNLDSVLPEEIGSVLSPMQIDKISFERTHTGDTDTVAEAEQNLFTAAGVSSLIFNNNKASANALTLSIKADQAITYGIVKSIEGMLNRLIQAQPFGKNFRVTYLDCSPFNRKEVGDMYLKACQYGMPMVSYYCASQGLGQAELDSMNFLENEVLGIKKLFIPLQSSATQSSEDSNGATDEGGAPEKGIDELSESGEQNREDA